jgi:ArsR family transcriptional regulator
MSRRICQEMRDLCLFFAALADENRLRLLYLMKEGEICVCYLQGVLQTNQPKISRHLAYLKKAGLVEARRDGKWMHYRLKKLGRSREKIFSETLRGLEKEISIKKDAQRIKQIQCCPSRYGIPAVDRTARTVKAG